MTLADISLPVSLEWARSHVLVFDSAFAQRIYEIQGDIGDTRYLIMPRVLSGGMCCLSADLLTECIPHGFLHEAFSRLDASQFNQIAVIPLGEAMAWM